MSDLKPIEAWWRQQAYEQSGGSAYTGVWDRKAGDTVPCLILPGVTLSDWQALEAVIEAVPRLCDAVIALSTAQGGAEECWCQREDSRMHTPECLEVLRALGAVLRALAAREEGR